MMTYGIALRNEFDEAEIPFPLNQYTG